MKTATILEKMNLVVQNLTPSGYKMGDLFTLRVINEGEELCVTHDTREYYSGKGSKYNSNIKHGEVNITMTPSELSKAFKPLNDARKEALIREKEYQLFVEKCKDPEFVRNLAIKQIAVVGRLRYENYGLSKEEFEVSNYHDATVGGGFHAQPDEGYRGAGVYRIAVKNKKITATLYGGYHGSKPDAVETDLWLQVVSEELAKHGSILKADGSGATFFLREESNLLPSKVYDVPSARGGLHKNIEVVNQFSS